LRGYFRYDRKLLGRLCRAAWETINHVFSLEIDGDTGVPAMVGAIQTFGDLIHWHSHIHTIVAEGVFTESGHFVHIPDGWRHRAVDFWRDKVFDLGRLPKVPSQAAVDKIFARLYEHDDGLHIRDRLMAELAYGSGLRRTELARLNVEDLDIESNRAHVMGKGDKPRVVPITSRTAETIREHLRRRHISRGPLFVSWFGGRMRPQSVYYTLRERVGIRPHLLRHACATHMLKNGCGVRVIQELLGHAKLDTTYLYTAVDKQDLLRVVNAAHPRAK